MRTQCIPTFLQFQLTSRRKVVARFDAGRVSSDGGILLLAELDRRIGLVHRFAQCFIDRREAKRSKYSLEMLLRQRILGLCLGYEDLNDHDILRNDALLSLAVGKTKTLGTAEGSLAGKSTLNRLELGSTKPDRYKKIAVIRKLMERFFVDEFIRAHRGASPKRLVLDFDASDLELHGKQEKRFYHGYYRKYCYLPLYVTCGDALLWADVRKANIDASAGTTEVLEKLVPILRAKWPQAELVIRADSGFAREAIFEWCENNNIHYTIGLSKNERLNAIVADEMTQARRLAEIEGKSARVFASFSYQTRKSWSCARRVVAKAEALPGKDNHRYIVTSYPVSSYSSKSLYEQEYCARGEMENRIKEVQLDLFGDRVSAGTMGANQLRVWLSAVAYCLTVTFRRIALRGTELERAQAHTIRSRLLKVGAIIKLSVRRIVISLSSVFPYQRIFYDALKNIKVAYPLLI